MKRLLIPAAIIIAAAFFASQAPDGLESVAARLGFWGKVTENAAPLAGYQVRYFGSSAWSTAAAGLAGLLIIGGIFYMSDKIRRKRSPGDPQKGATTRVAPTREENQL